MGRCKQCHQPLVEIDHWGERLTGCKRCNRWQASTGEWCRLAPDDIVALRAIKAQGSTERFPVSSMCYLSLTALLSESPLSEEGVEEMSGNRATSGYRVAMVSGALEVSARLATAEELDLLVRVLEANKILWANSVTSKPNLLSRKFKIDFPDELALAGANP